MERTIFDIMDDHPSRVSDFYAAMDELLNAQYILAGVRISSVLKAIAASRVMYSLFDRLLGQFDYKQAAKSCMAEGGTRIILPESKEERAAFVFCVLLDIDKHNINLGDFLQFFGGGAGGSSKTKNNSDNEAFALFLSEFAAALKSSVWEILDEQRAKQAEQTDKAEREAELKRLRQNFDRFMGTFIARINSSDLDTIIKDELTLLCGDFAATTLNSEQKEATAKYNKLIKKLNHHMPPLAKELSKYNF